jgi:hypothetical protein
MANPASMPGCPLRNACARCIKIKSTVARVPPVGAGLPAKDVNDDVFQQDRRGVFEIFAGSQLLQGSGDDTVDVGAADFMTGKSMTKNYKTVTG